MHDLKNLTNGDAGYSQEIAPLLRTASVDGAGVDMQLYEAVHFVVDAGTVTDGTFTVVVEESTTGAWAGEETAVADADLDGTEVAITSANDLAPYVIRYRGIARYVRLTIIASGGPATGGTIGCIAIRHGTRSYNGF